MNGHYCEKRALRTSTRYMIITLFLSPPTVRLLSAALHLLCPKLLQGETGSEDGHTSVMLCKPRSHPFGMLQKLVCTVLDAGGLVTRKKKRDDHFVSFQLELKKNDTPRSW